MAHFSKRQFIVDGKPVLVLAGEVHYFRVAREEWEDRIRKTKAAGCNAIASYIPWMFHEERQGDIDLTGRTRPERDLGAFIDQCHRHGLWFIARPGPYTMGEIKNEGLPDWIEEKCPEARPTTWSGKKATSKNLNYLDHDLLRYAERWYGAVMPILAKRLHTKGGNVIAVQLDNEIGMLQCWTEEADLSEDVLCQFAEFVQKRHSPADLAKRYPFDIGDPAARAKYLWDGTFESARCFHTDYAEFTRERFAKYAATLRKFAEDHGIADVPYIINIHGSGGGRATTFPIGISQCFRAYTQAPEFWGSSDHYLGEITRQNVQDLYFLNAFMASVNLPDQPLSSVEFEAGTGDYGETGAVRQSGAATDFKARLSVVQGNRMLNHYLLAGGHNPLLDKPKQDGNGRLGTTGGRHGFAAPIGPEGQLDPVYHALAETNHTLLALESQLAVAEEEHDEIALGFLPDYYTTDVKRPGPMMDMVRKVESARGPLEGMTRNMLLHGLSFPAINLQEPIPAGTKAIALSASACLDGYVQDEILDWVKKGGKLLLYIGLPMEDMEGRPATQLFDALGIKLLARREGSSFAFPSIAGVGWAKHEPEVRLWSVVPFSLTRGEPFLKLTQTDEVIAAHIPVGMGEVTYIAAELPFHPSLWDGIFRRLGAEPAIRHDDPLRGTVLSRLNVPGGGRLISLVNLDQEEKWLRLTSADGKSFPDRVYLPKRTAKLIPFDLEVAGVRIAASTAEICRVEGNRIAFRPTFERETIHFLSPVHLESGHATLHGQTAVLQPGRDFVWFRKA